jgi:hypothetical protein
MYMYICILCYVYNVSKQQQVVGEPIEVTKTPDPTEEQITELLNEYCESLTQLYHRNEQYNVPRGKQLTII